MQLRGVAANAALHPGHAGVVYRDPWHVVSFVGQSLRRGGRRPRECLTLQLPTTLPTMNPLFDGCLMGQGISSLEPVRSYGKAGQGQ
jgi:hypothetical protein